MEIQQITHEHKAKLIVVELVSRVIHITATLLRQLQLYQLMQCSCLQEKETPSKHLNFEAYAVDHILIDSNSMPSYKKSPTHAMTNSFKEKQRCNQRGKQQLQGKTLALKFLVWLPDYGRIGQTYRKTPIGANFSYELARARTK